MWLTGHSLGGALASLTAVKLVLQNVTTSDKLKLITFGQPRVGEKNFSDFHDRLIPYGFRVTHRLDLVPHIPPCHKIPQVHGCSPGYGTYYAYHHGLEVFFPDEEMQVNNYIVCTGQPEDEDSNCSDGLWEKKFIINDHYNYYNHSFNCNTNLS